MALSGLGYSVLCLVTNKRKIAIWMLCGDERTDGFILLNIKYELEDLLKCKIDIVRLRDNMNALLKRNIDRDGIYV